MQKEYIIGLDLGINNVGYSVIENNQIVKKGVRIYTVASKAEDRRVSRNTRRRMKRRENRISETLALFNQIQFPNQNTIDADLLQKRIKGLKEQLEKQDIVNIVCYFMRHRGYIPFGDEERNLIDLKGKYPCEYYEELQESVHKFRALEDVVNHEDLVRELTTILNVQQKYYPELEKIMDAEKGLLWVFSRKRKFWEGPGSINSFTPFGRFQSESDVEEYLELKKQGGEKFLFEDLIGKCKRYPNEKCAPRGNIYAEQFNLINDFINIRIISTDNLKKQDYAALPKHIHHDNNNNDTYKLTTKAIEDILEYCMTSKEKSLSYTKVLKDVLGLNKRDIDGYRITKDGNPEFSLMKNYRAVMRSFQEKNLDTDWLTENDYQGYNKLIQVLSIAPGIVEIKEMMSPYHALKEDELNMISTLKEKLKKEKALEYHSLSEKALKQAIKDMLSYNMNFMQVSKELDYDKDARELRLQEYGSGEGLLKMNSMFVDDIIASPQVKKTLRQAIRIINAIIKEKGGYPSVIAIESTHEMNGEEKKKEIEQYQKAQESMRKEAIKLLESINAPVTENLIERVLLYLEVNGECPYCGKPVSINDALNDNIEKEHILPISQSGDNSQNNKTVTCRDCNARKGNKTPYQFLTEQEFEEFKNRISKLKISEEKRYNFLTQDDLNKYHTRFFNRNLRDTAYATSELVNQVHYFNEYLQKYLKDVEVKTLSTPGQLTHAIRKQWNLHKDRDDGRYHHAVDASIVAGIATTPLGKMIISSQNESKFWKNNKSAEKQITEYLEDFSLPTWKDEISKIQSDEDILISMQVNKDVNREISNANISSYIKKEEDFYIIEQIDNIYAPDLMRNNKEKLEVLFDEENPKFILLCQEQDPKLFKLLKFIYERYQDGNRNPFLLYCEEMHEELTEKTPFDVLKHGIHAPSKNGKGAIVKKIRYMRKVTDPFLIDKKNINKKENTYIGYDSVGVYRTDLYWDEDLKKIIFIPIYIPVMDFKTKEINKNHPLYQLYYDKFLKGKNVKFIVSLYNGNYVEIEKSNNTFTKEYIKGYSKANKSIQCKSGGYLSPKDKFTLYDVDILGNKKKRLTWPEE